MTTTTTISPPLSIWRRVYLRSIYLTRLLHIVLALLGSLLILFFALTGLLLHHPGLLGENPLHSTTSTALVPAAMLAGPDKLPLVEFLRDKCGAIGSVNKVDLAANPIHVTFLTAGRRLDATIDRTTSQATLKWQWRSIFNRFMDLHKAHFGGPFWGYLLDGAAILMFLSALSGIVIWLPMKKWRMIGVIALILAVGLCLGVYVWTIP